MSITDFMALVLSWVIEARKFPAAPALNGRELALALSAPKPRHASSKSIKNWLSLSISPYVLLLFQKQMNGIKNKGQIHDKIDSS